MPDVQSISGIQSRTFETDQSRPALGFLPEVMADGFTIKLRMQQTVRDFIGYDLDGKRDVWDYVESKGSNSDPRHGFGQSPLANSKPIPIFKVRQETSQALLWDGQTLVLGGLAVTAIPPTNSGVLNLSSLPNAGQLFRLLPEKKANVLFFITPIIVNSHGDPLHKPVDMPFSENGVPPQ
jgi:type II secretory pathway component GspD/PulD (secretin)